MAGRKLAHGALTGSLAGAKKTIASAAGTHVPTRVSGERFSVFLLTGTDRQRQTDRQTGRQTDRQTDRHTYMRVNDDSNTLFTSMICLSPHQCTNKLDFKYSDELRRRRSRRKTEMLQTQTPESEF